AKACKLAVIALAAQQLNPADANPLRGFAPLISGVSRQGENMAAETEHVQERVLASGLMTMAAGKSSAVIDSFVSWLIAGAGGAIALVIGNLSAIGPRLDASLVACASVIYLVAAGLTVIEKFLAAIVMGAAASASQAKDFVRDLPPDGSLEMEVVFREF